jgi:hypothetical protein
MHSVNVAVLIRIWLFLFSTQPKHFILDALKKLEQRRHQCVELGGGGICGVNTFFQPPACCFPYKAKDLSAPFRMIVTSFMDLLCAIASCFVFHLVSEVLNEIKLETSSYALYDLKSDQEQHT